MDVVNNQSVERKTSKLFLNMMISPVMMILSDLGIPLTPMSGSCMEASGTSTGDRRCPRCDTKCSQASMTLRAGRRCTSDSLPADRDAESGDGRSLACELEKALVLLPRPGLSLLLTCLPGAVHGNVAENRRKAVARRDSRGDAERGAFIAETGPQKLRLKFKGGSMQSNTEHLGTSPFLASFLSLQLPCHLSLASSCSCPDLLPGGNPVLATLLLSSCHPLA
eukprot:761684-Hanusia_phi.AAC.14